MKKGMLCSVWSNPLRICMSSILSLFFSMIIGSGCGGRLDIYEERLEIHGPIVVGYHLAYLDKTRERVIVVRPFTGEIMHKDVGRNPVFMLPSPDQAELLIVCKGWVAESTSEEDEEPSLVILNLENGEQRSYSLESPFDEVAVSDDNRYAVAYFSVSHVPGEREVFRNPNSVAILDMDTGDVVHKTVRSFGDIPRGVLFSPPDMAPIRTDSTPGSPRTFAVVFAQDYLTFLDVTNPGRREVTVRLTLPEMGSRNMVGQQMVFVPSAGNGFLRVSSSSDIYTFTFMEREPTEPGGNDFVLSVNTLAAGSVPGDMAVYEQDGEQKVLVANYASKDVAVIDGYSSQLKSISLGSPVDRIILHPEKNPRLAIVYCKSSPQSRIHFIRLQDLEEMQGKNLDTLYTSQPVLSIDRIPGRDRFLVTHDDTRSVMSVLNPDEQTLIPFTAHAGLSGYAINTSGTVLAGFTAGGSRLGLVNISDLSVRTLMLAHVPRRVLALRKVEHVVEDGEMNAIVVDHESEAGLLTVIPNPLVADRENTFLMSGFLLGGVFDDRFK